MMSQLLRTDIKLINGLARLHFGSGGGFGLGSGSQIRGEVGFGCPNCGKGIRALSIDSRRLFPGFPAIGRGHVPGFARLFSIKPSSSPLMSTVKKSKKRAKKTTKSTTEIIRESEDALMSESEALLLSLPSNSKELASYLVKFTPEKSTSKSPIPLNSSPGHMSYSTSGFLPFPMFNYSEPAESTMASPSAAFDTSRGGVYLAERDNMDMEQTLNSDEAFDDSMVIPNNGSTRLTIPQEKDLIDSDIDFEAELNEKLRLAKLAEDKSDESADVSVNRPIQVVGNKNTKNSKRKIKARLKSSEKELLAKVKREEMERLGREVSLNKSLLAYLDMCIFTKQLNRGLNTLNYYRHRGKTIAAHARVTDIKNFNFLLHGFAMKGHITKVKEIFKSILEDDLKPSVQTYAAILECLGRLASNTQNRQNLNYFIDHLARNGYDINDLFNETVFAGDQREMVLQAIRRRDPKFVPTIQKPSTEYSCGLLQNLNTSSCGNPVTSPAEGLMTMDYLQSMTHKQLQMELKGTITIKSVERKDDLENLPYYRKLLQDVEDSWSVAIKEAMERNLVSLLHHGMKLRSHKTISIQPFLKVLQPEDYVGIITQEIRKLAEGSETYSPGVSQLYRELGYKVLARYQVLYKKEKGILEKVQHLYNEYNKWYLHPSSHGSDSSRNPRQKWQELLHESSVCGPDVDIDEKTWPNSVLSSVGRFLYCIIMRDIKIDAQIMKQGPKSQHLVPAFYSIFRLQGVHLKEEIKPHPALVKLFQAASKDELTFDATVVPMLSPPLPWASIRTGGYLLTPAKIIRLPFQAHQQKVRLESCPPEDLYPSLDSLNQLGAVPWKINHRVLDTVIEVFNAKGDDDLGIPPPPSECPLPPAIDVNMTRQEKLLVHKTRLALKRKKAEMYSLWCDALYRLSLANHFREDIFWFPHNMDFRGRVYPCPPHLNHLGADMARSILVFAQGKPLGTNGLDWLKIHLVNLTGLKKRNSVQERLNYADEILEDILDSADNPLTGRKWWAESEEPWQTLACCMEIANAIRSGDPTTYVTHFPVHQDGSCNGLQHYAALGRDQAGAESVNLAPSPIPQDVYSSVATLVEKLREEDAKKGVAIAQVLEGFIMRKVIKQTVMTTVYGVTRFGARLQIAKQLKDIPNFPKEHIWPASLYLVGRTFDSLQEMFTSTKEIQDWFTECARLISQVCGQNVEWITPLGLPVVQPYFRVGKKSHEGFDPFKLPELHMFDAFERPNVMKQKNAFPPNFIHSLDSSHMMLTSLNAEQSGITFVSVHDCYWTHPCSVEIMNRICREQFVALHSEPILEQLSTFLVDKYSYKESEFFKDGSVTDDHKSRLNQLLTEVPAKGSFDLRSVLKSTYFFS